MQISIENFNMTVSDSNHLFGYYDDYLYELIEYVYQNTASLL